MIYSVLMEALNRAHSLTLWMFTSTDNYVKCYCIFHECHRLNRSALLSWYLFTYFFSDTQCILVVFSAWALLVCCSEVHPAWHHKAYCSNPQRFPDNCRRLGVIRGNPRKIGWLTVAKRDREREREWKGGRRERREREKCGVY